jgi:hypothetical protein
MMDRFLRRAVGTAVVALLAATGAWADVPDPSLSNVPDVIPVAPNGGLTYQVTIVGSGGPINASQVEVRFAVAGDTLVCWCTSEPGPSPRKRFAVTNGSGVATFNLRAGGCIELGNIPDAFGPIDYVAEVFADGVKMAECGVVSPDVVDGNGKKATDVPTNWDPNGSCAVGVGDAVFHTTPIAGGPAAYDYCTDIDGDGVAGGIDAIILTPFLAGSTSCAGDAGN